MQRVWLEHHLNFDSFIMFTYLNLIKQSFRDVVLTNLRNGPWTALIIAYANFSLETKVNKVWRVVYCVK